MSIVGRLLAAARQVADERGRAVELVEDDATALSLPSETFDLTRATISGSQAR